jgi:protein-L-isoaspartate(D-aspartate) O-methyltransferase
VNERWRSEHWPPQWPDVHDPAVVEAMAAVPRHLFVPPQYRDQAYEDIPLPIGHGQTISQPYIVALMTQALHLQPDSRVLEIGTGSGYQSAILAHITRFVWSVETIPELAEAARERLQGLGLDVALRAGDGRLGWPEYAPYDGIIVTAASPDVPPALAVQLAEGGRLVIPVGGGSWDQALWLIRREGEMLQKQYLADVRFVPLVATPSSSGPEDAVQARFRKQLQGLFGHR